MKIAMMTLGSTGDVYPFQVLGEYLVQHGHKVTLFTQQFHKKTLKDSQVEFVGYGDEQGDFLLFNKMLDRVFALNNPVKKMRLLLEQMYLYRGEEHFHLFKKMSQGYDIGLVNMYDHISMEALIQNNIPWMTVDFCPALVPTKYDAPENFPSMGAKINLLLWQLCDRLFKSCDERITTYLKGLGGNRHRVSFMATFSPHGHLYALSQHVAKLYPDLPPNHLITGPWQPSQNFSKGWQPSNELNSFLNAGEKPVVFSFGSMGGSNGKILTQIIIDAVKRVGCRAVIQKGYASLGQQVPVDAYDQAQFIFVDYVPHHWLFRQAAMVVHHGGAGTTLAACTAGVPSIVIPHLADQPYWANRLKKLGVAPKPIFHHHFTASTLVHRIKLVFSKELFANNAKQLSLVIAKENGLESAKKIIENTVVNDDGFKKLKTPRLADRFNQTAPAKPAFCYKQSLMIDNPLAFFYELSHRYGDFIQYRGLVNFYQVNHPDLVKQILKETNLNFNKRTTLYDQFRSVFGNGLVTAEGDHWLNQRKLLQPMFTPTAVKSYFNIMLESSQNKAQQLIETYGNTTAFDLAKQMKQLTLEIAGKALFNDDFGHAAKDIELWTHFINRYSGRTPWPLLSKKWFPTPTNIKLNQTMKAFHAFVQNMIDHRRSAQLPEDLLTRLINAKEVSSELPMSDHQIIKEVIGMIIGGHETSSSALSWVWYELTQHPEVEKKLHLEIDSVIGNRPLTLNDIPKLKYTRMIADEILRLYPPFWFENRNTKNELQLWGHKVPKGSMIVFSRHALQRHPQFWDRPNDFFPERFETFRTQDHHQRSAYVPFGGGPRICIGINFAILELMVVMVAMAQKIKFLLHESNCHQPQALLTLEPKFGVIVNAQSRSSMSVGEVL